MAQEIDETFKRIQAHKGVDGILVMNSDGICVKTTLDNTTAVLYACHIHTMVIKTRTVIKDIDGSNDLKFIRIRSKQHEILVAPDQEYTMIVIQKYKC